MHFTSNNLLHNFSNGKYMLFSLFKKKKIHVKNMSQLDPTHNPIDPTQTCLACFAMSNLTQPIKSIMCITHDKIHVIFLLLPNIFGKKLCCQLLFDNLLSINFIYLFLNNNKRNPLNSRLCKGGRSQYLVGIKNTLPQNNIILN